MNTNQVVQQSIPSLPPKEPAELRTFMEARAALFLPLTQTFWQAYTDELPLWVLWVSGMSFTSHRSLPYGIFLALLALLTIISVWRRRKTDPLYIACFSDCLLIRDKWSTPSAKVPYEAINAVVRLDNGRQTKLVIETHDGWHAVEEGTLDHPAPREALLDVIVGGLANPAEGDSLRERSRQRESALQGSLSVYPWAALLLGVSFVFATGVTHGVHLADGLMGVSDNGANMTVLVQEGHYLRGFNALLNHYGSLQLFIDLLFLYVLGRPLEKAMGSSRFIIVATVSAFGGAVAHILDEPTLALASALSTASGILAASAMLTQMCTVEFPLSLQPALWWHRSLSNPHRWPLCMLILVFVPTAAPHSSVLAIVSGGIAGAFVTGWLGNAPTVFNRDVPVVHFTACVLLAVYMLVRATAYQ